ncbi:MAG: hypothetical protein CM15mV10_1530 [uncultured marine virus]|nr:MAG: hypothetical protein CM15mV10_1530 [uncultured marine virus]
MARKKYAEIVAKGKKQKKISKTLEELSSKIRRVKGYMKGGKKKYA